VNNMNSSCQLFVLPFVSRLIKVKYVWLILLIAAGLSACKKNPSPNQTGPVDIYLAGWRSYYPSNEVAVYWKNGVLTDLTDGSRYITANSIAVSGNNVYVGGNDFINNHSVAKYWKNGVIANLEDTTVDSHVSAIAVSGNGIYFAGYENEGNHKIAKYWKNGQGVNLTSGVNDAELLAITVSGNDVYVAGWESNGTFEVAKYWKNGIAVSLSDGSKNAEALSVAVSGNDVYVTGNEYTAINSCPSCAAGFSGTSKLWENGSIIRTAGNNQFFGSIAASNKELYIAGNDGSYASYFKNGSIFHLTDGTNEAETSAIAIWGNDVYVTGYENIAGHNIPTYWKNGAAIHLTNGLNNAYASAIYVNKQ